ncbi:MAG: S9 family peptidase [Gemmatimonadota bacterium]
MKICSLALTAVVLSAAPLRAQSRPLTPTDALRLTQVGEPLISPDGRRVVWSQRTIDWDTNRWHTSWWSAPATGGTPRRFLGDPEPSDVLFAPTGGSLSFLREVDGRAQVHALPLAGGEARVLTRHPTSIESHEWSGDGRWIVFLAPDSTAPAVEAGDDAWFVDEGPNSDLAGVWKNLWLLDPRDGSTRRLTRLAMHVFEYEVSPTGDRVLLVARASSNRNDIDQNEIWLLHVQDGRLERLTDNAAVEDRVQWTPDGRGVTWAADDSISWTHKEDKLFALDLADRQVRLLSEAFPGRIARYWWHPDGQRIRFTALVRTNTNLWELDTATGGVRALTDATGDLDVTALSADQRMMAYTFADHATAPDVLASPLPRVEPVRITDLDPWLEREVARADMEIVRWPSADGLEIEGLLFTPRGSVGPLPLVLQIHGGPPGFWDDTWTPQPHIYAGLGYAVFAPNVRGSAGYGDTIREANTFYRGDGIGMGDYDDLMTGLDMLVRRGVVDPERIGVRGWSYGAILGAYALTRTDRFRAAALGAGVYDWRAEFGMGYHWDVTRWYIGGTPWSDPAAWDDQSTLPQADRITTPLLLFHGLADHTTSEPQSMMLYSSLRVLGNAPVRYLRVPRESHGFREPLHIRRQMVEEIRWMERWVREREWNPEPLGRAGG